MNAIEKFLNDYGIETDWSTISLSLTVMMAIGFFYIARYLVGRIAKKHGNPIALSLLRRFNLPLQFLVLLTAVVILLNRIVDDINQQVWYQKTYSIVVIFVLSWMAVKAITVTSDWMMSRFNTGVRDNLRARRILTQIRVFRRLVVALVILIGIASSLMVFDQIRALGVSLIASAGLAGIILGLAAQKTLGNFFTGLQIAIAQPIRIGDVVVVENEWGTIEEINLTYIVVKIWDLRRLILPVNYFVEKPFQNWTRNSADILGTVTLFLDYNTPMDAIRTELDRILDTEKVKALWDGKVKVAQVVDATEKTINVRILVSAHDSPSAFDLRCLVREGLITFIQKNYPDSLPRVRGDVSPQLSADAA